MAIVKYHRRNLHQQNEWHSHNKIPVPGLMAKQIHSQPCSNTSPHNTYKKQNFFRNPPPVMHRTALIHSHHGNPYTIYNNEICNNYFYHILSICRLSKIFTEKVVCRKAYHFIPILLHPHLPRLPPLLPSP